MNVIKGIIIDDEPDSTLILSRMCSKIGNLEIIKKYNDPLEALQEINPSEIDVVFLDIHMEGISGLDFIKVAKGLPSVIITTHDKNFALEAFEYNVVDYLVKPITTTRLIKAINRVREKLELESNSKDTNSKEDIYVNINRKLIRLVLNEISVIEAKGDYVLVKTDNGNHIIHSSLKKIEEKLPEETFLKVHRSYIVNISKIVDIKDNTIVIGREVIPVSRSQKENLLNKLNTL